MLASNFDPPMWSNFFRYILICLFATGVVALGAHELHKAYAKKGAGIAKEEIIQKLQGVSDVERARFVPELERKPVEETEKVGAKDASELSRIIDYFSGDSKDEPEE